MAWWKNLVICTNINYLLRSISIAVLFDFYANFCVLRLSSPRRIFSEAAMMSPKVRARSGQGIFKKWKFVQKSRENVIKYRSQKVHIFCTLLDLRGHCQCLKRPYCPADAKVWVMATLRCGVKENVILHDPNRHVTTVRRQASMVLPRRHKNILSYSLKAWWSLIESIRSKPQ